MHEDIKIEDKELELDLERAPSTENQTQDFVTCSDVQAIIAVGMEKVASDLHAPALLELGKDKLLDVRRDGYYAAEGLETPLSILVGEVISTL